MAYGFAQRVIRTDPQTVFRTARREASERGYRVGRVSRRAGMMGERLVRLLAGPVEGRLWVWPIAPGISVAYLGLDEDASPAPAWRSRRLDRTAAELLDGLPEARPLTEEPIAA